MKAINQNHENRNNNRTNKLPIEEAIIDNAAKETEDWKMIKRY